MTEETPTPAELEIIERRKAKLDAERLWRRRLVETLESFPVRPFGTRVIVLQRQPEHLSKGGILLPTSREAPLSGWVVAVPGHRRIAREGELEEASQLEFSMPEQRIHLEVGDEVLFPEHASHRISVMVGMDNEEQHEQKFLVIDAQDLHGVVVKGHVDSLREVVPGLEKDVHVTGSEIASG